MAMTVRNTNARLNYFRFLVLRPTSDQIAGYLYGLFGVSIAFFGFTSGILIDYLGVRKSLLFGAFCVLIGKISILVVKSKVSEASPSISASPSLIVLAESEKGHFNVVILCAHALRFCCGSQ